MEKKPVELIDFQKQRDFGELIGAPFNFLKQEFKPFVKVLARYVGPFLGIGLLAMMIFSRDMYHSATSFSGSMMPSSGISMFIFIFFLSVSFFMAALISHSYITLYVNEGKDKFTSLDVWQLAKSNIGKFIAAGFLIGLMVGFGFLFLYIPGIYLGVALSFVFFVIVFEGESVGKAISRSFAIIKGNWWFTFGILLVFGMIMGFTSYIFMIPGYIIGMFSAATGEFGAVDVIVIVISMALYFASYLFLGSLQQVLVGFVYFSLTGKKEGVNLDSKINAIYPTEDLPEDKNQPINPTNPASPTNTPPEKKSRIEDYYPELSDTPSWSKTEKSEEKPPKRVDEKNEKEKNRFEKKDDNNRFRPKDENSNRFEKGEDGDDDYDRFKPKY